MLAGPYLGAVPHLEVEQSHWTTYKLVDKGIGKRHTIPAKHLLLGTKVQYAPRAQRHVFSCCYPTRRLAWAVTNEGTIHGAHILDQQMAICSESDADMLPRQKARTFGMLETYVGANPLPSVSADCDSIASNCHCIWHALDTAQQAQHCCQ